MKKFDIVFKNRDFSTRPDPGNLNFQVNSYSFKAVGGCHEALIDVSGGNLDIWDLINWLRFPVAIYDPIGVPVWWGYVHKVNVRQGTLEVAASLGSMANRVAVAYSYVEPGSAMVGTRKTTAWADNLDSQAEFGIKEFLSSAAGLSDAAAENRRAAILAGQAWPLGGVSLTRMMPTSRNNKLTAALICRGWWDTLDWQMYANTGTTSVATTTQIGAIVTAEGQFLTATDIDTASGISSSEYRDGDSSALKEILSLLAAGGAGGRRLLSSVDINRRVQIFEEPASSTTGYYMDSAARLYGTGGIWVNETTPPVGVWCRLKDVIPGVVDLTKLVDPSLQFIEAASWSSNGGVSYEFKGKPGADSLLAIGG